MNAFNNVSHLIKKLVISLGFKYSSSKVFQGTLFIFISNIISKAIGFLLIMLIAKHLGVDEYGKLTVILALMTTVADFVSSGLNSSLVRYSAKYISENKYEKLTPLLSTAFVNILLIGVMLALVIYFTSDSLSQFLLDSSQYNHYIEITSFGIIFTLVSGIYSSLFLGIQNYLKYFYYSVFSQLIRIILFFVIINIFEDSLMAIVILFVITPLLAFLFGYYLEKNIKLNILAYDINILKEIFSFGKWVFLWGVVAIIQSRMDIYLLAHLSNTEEVAFFDMAQKFVLIVMMAFGAYGAALNPKMAGLSKSFEIQSAVKNTYKVIFVMTLFLVTMYFLIPLIINYIFSNKYDSSILPFQIMIISSFFHMLAMPFNASVYAIGKSQVFFYSSLIALVINLVSSLYFIPLYGSIGASISYIFVNVSSLLTAYMFYKYYIKRIN